MYGLRPWVNWHAGFPQSFIPSKVFEYPAAFIHPDGYDANRYRLIVRAYTCSFKIDYCDNRHALLCVVAPIVLPCGQITG